MQGYKTGLGIESHKFIQQVNRRLYLGGVEIDSPLALEGRADADVIIHAVIDSLMGAAGLGDSSRQFPPTDRKYKTMQSLQLLEKTRELLVDINCRIIHIDITVMCSQLKLAGYIGVMSGTIAKTLGIKVDQVNIKTSQSAAAGMMGADDGISAMAVATIYSD